jgi:hypothetical protein
MVDLDGLYRKSTKGALHELERICHVFYPSGKPRIPHLLCLSRSIAGLSRVRGNLLQLRP